MNKTPIDPKLLDKFECFPRKGNPVPKLFFRREKIVPEEYQHPSLICNNKVERIIFDYYFLPTKNFKTKAIKYFEYDQNVQERYLPVYQSYFPIDVVLEKFRRIVQEKTSETKDIKYFEDLQPYFRDYEKGFKYGYVNFKKDKLDKHLLFNDDEQGVISKIFNFVIKNWELTEYKVQVEMFDTTFHSYKTGVREGYLYGAWSYILGNNHLFAPLFETHFKKLNENRSQKGNSELSLTKKLIVDKFSGMDKTGWEYAFKSEDDLNNFTEILTRFFEFKEYILPDSTINLKRRSKTKIAKILNEIHKDLSENKLIEDKEFFQIIRLLNHFEKEIENDLYKSLTR